MPGRSAINLRQIAAAFALILATLSIAYMYYETGRRDLVRQEHERLNAVAELKSQQLGDWLSERIKDARIATEGGIASGTFSAFLKYKSEHDRELCLQWLVAIKRAYNCKELILTDGKCGIALSTNNSEPIVKDEAAMARSAMDSGRILVNNLTRAPSGQIHMDVVAPIKPAGSKSGIGALFLMFDPNDNIYPALQAWPNPSRTGETLLVRREGDDILFLNELRHRKGTALRLRYPVSSPNLPAAMAVRGFKGALEGVDYRGVRVLSAVRPVEGTSWFLVAKIDTDEIYAPLHKRAVMAVFLSVIILAGATLLIVQKWQLREKEFLRSSLLEHERAATELAEREENLAVTLASIGDGVIATDERGVVTRINGVAEGLTGWPASEAVGRHLDEVFVIVNEDSRLPVENPVFKVLETGLIVGLANHTALIARDGSERPIADSGAPIKGKDGSIIGVVLVFRDQTEERENEKKILASLNFHLSLFNDLPALIWCTDAHGRCDYFNRTWLQFRGRELKDELEEGWTKGIHPEDLDHCLEIHRTAFMAREPFEMQFRLQNYIGEYRWVKGIGRPYKGPDGAFAGYIGSCFDITGQKRAQDIIKRSNDLLNKVFDAVPDLVVVLDRDRRLIHSNWHGILENVPEEIRSDNPFCYEILQQEKDGFCDHCQTLQVINSCKPGVIESSLPGQRLFEVRSYPIIDDSGSVSMVVKNYRDITEHRKTEEQLRHAQKMEAIGALAGGVAHDFNNLLTVIVGYCNVLKLQPCCENAGKEHVEKILAAANRAGELTKGLLAYSRKNPILAQQVNINETIIKVVALLSRIIGEDIEIITLLSTETVYVMVDPVQIEQVIMNLGTNARDAMNNGGRFLVKVSTAEIDPDFIEKRGFGSIGKYALLEISDSGTGMDKATLERIFEPFYTTKEVGKGTGLGLSIVYGIVKQHDGFIDVHSEPGIGTRFRIYLPISETMLDKSTVTEKQSVRGKGETILIIEDNYEIRRFLCTMLEEFGYNALEAENGDAGLAMFRHHGENIDLVIMDVIMPKKNGRETLDEMRKLKGNVKSIFISVYTADIMNSKGIEIVDLDILAKPFSPAILLTKVREALDQNVGESS